MFSLRSELRRKLLTFFTLNPKARAYVRQLASDLGADSTNVSRELARLAREGFLRAEREGRQLYYSIIREYPYRKAVLGMLRGSLGIEPSLRRVLGTIPAIESAWLYGSFAKDEADAASDIDLLIVGRPDQARLATETRKLEKALRREINYTVLTPRELKRRLAARDAFLSDIWKGKRIELTVNGHPATTRESRSGETVPRRRA